ncbi:hypothetical protein KAW50_03635 [candidate division WOR-3 bacterium]|nr:hypothetical protein [candidate division WOR-3 bacterium]
MKKNKEQIRQRIQIKRGIYTHARRKRFLYLKRTGALEGYYAQRNKKPELINILKPEKKIELKSSLSKAPEKKYSLGSRIFKKIRKLFRKN